MPRYVAFIASSREKFSFLPDYNARYTVLAGSAFLREGEQILYDTLPGKSQSLAVTTLLDSPYEQNSLFSILPSGGYSIGQKPDTVIENTVTLDHGYPVLTVSDSVSHSVISRVVYTMKNPKMNICSYTDSIDSCLENISANTIRFIQNTTSSFIPSIENGNITLKSGNTSVVTIDK